MVFLTNNSREYGEPTLNWFEIQPEFKYSKADVLLVLDCCYAAQSARGREERNKIELLAACVMRLQTPKPGPQSFTSRLMRVLREISTTGNPRSTAQIVQQLAKADAGLVQTPYYLPLQSEGHDRPILLMPLPRDTEADKSTQKTVCSLVFHVSLTKRLTENALPDIVRWLKDGAPDAVSNLSVKEIAGKSERLHEFTLVTPQTQQVSLFERLDGTAKQDILNAWNDLCKLVGSGEIGDADQVPSGASSQEVSRSLARPTIETYFRRLHELNQRMSRAILRNVLKLPELEDSKFLNRLTDDELNHSIGLTEPLRVKMAILSHAQLSPDLQFSEDSKIIKETSFGSKTLAEYRYYGANEGDNTISLISDRIQKLAALLNRSTSSNFCTLHCRGWVHEPSLLRFGLVFDVPNHFDYSPLSFNHIIKATKGMERPSLEKRFHIANLLGQALQTWHWVGWLHQNISSHYVVLFRNRNTSDIDYDSPYLTGFEFARPNSAYSIPRGQDSLQLDIYRHPDRQGTPQRPHRKEDDLYSFGVLLLEIGLWQTASSILGIEKTGAPHPSPEDIRAKLLRNARQRLSHYMGTSYAHAVEMCLDGALERELDDKNQTQLARSFAEEVLDSLLVKLEEPFTEKS